MLVVGALFDPGRISVTPGALAVLRETATDTGALLERHVSGDWGSLPLSGVQEYERSIRVGGRILSSYPVADERERVWIITEADRSSTCLLLPSEY